MSSIPTIAQVERAIMENYLDTKRAARKSDLVPLVRAMGFTDARARLGIDQAIELSHNISFHREFGSAHDSYLPTRAYLREVILSIRNSGEAA